MDCALHTCTATHGFIMSPDAKVALGCMWNVIVLRTGRACWGAGKRHCIIPYQLGGHNGRIQRQAPHTRWLLVRMWPGTEGCQRKAGMHARGGDWAATCCHLANPQRCRWRQGGDTAMCPTQWLLGGPRAAMVGRMRGEGTYATAAVCRQPPSLWKPSLTLMAEGYQATNVINYPRTLCSARNWGWIAGAAAGGPGLAVPPSMHSSEGLTPSWVF